MNFVAVVFGLIGLLAAALGDTDDEWRQAALVKHNEYRKIHEAAPLNISQDLCVTSQKWADFLMSQEKGKDFVHSETKGLGENLYKSGRSGSGAADAKVAPEAAVKSWYDEIKDYDFGTGKSKSTAAVGHFTQIVWKGTKEVCVSYAKRTTGKDKVEFYVVANYRPAGNFEGNYVNNVAKGSYVSNSSQRSRKEVQQWHIWWISLGCIFTFSVYL